MPMAYVLLNTEIGSEHDVLSLLKKTEGVQEAFSLVGLYDIIARVKADTLNKLLQIINERFQTSKVLSKSTIIVSER